MMGCSEWFEVLFGAFLGFVVSILTTFVNRAIDKHGKMRIFYKLTHKKWREGRAGIEQKSGEMILSIPLYFELQNTSNTARVVRDVCLYLYKDGKEIRKMVQIQYMKDTKTNEVTNDFGGENYSYSFVLPPHSIQKRDCEFFCKISKDKIDTLAFDEIRFSYYDEKNRTMECLFCKAEQGWNGIDFKYENEYVELICKKK